MKLVLASENKGKINEFSKTLSTLGIEVCEAKISLPEETGTTYEENAKLKARFVYERYNLPTISDDSGLEIEALGGAPGIYSARFAGENKSDKERVEIILKELKNVPEEKRMAKLICVICLVENGEEVFFRGEAKGTLAFEPRSTRECWGYDPVFVAEGGKTFGEISREAKNKISHRGKAIQMLYNYMKKTRT